MKIFKIVKEDNQFQVYERLFWIGPWFYLTSKGSIGFGKAEKDSMARYTFMVFAEKYIETMSAGDKNKPKVTYDIG